MYVHKLAAGFALLAMFSSCSQQTQENSQAPQVQSKWRYVPKMKEIATPMGVVVSKAGDKTVVELSELKAWDSFETAKKIGVGYQSTQDGLLYIAFNMPGFASPEQWIKDDGPHWIFRGDLQGGAITGEMSIGGGYYVYERVSD